MTVDINPRLRRLEPMRRCRLEECRAACCLYGVWVDVREADEILKRAGLIIPHMPEESRDPDLWFDGEVEPDEHALSGKTIHSAVLPAPDHYGGIACVFLRSDYKCALQVASEAAGFHPWHFKPFYCILHPLDFDEQQRITLDETETMLAEPGSCLRPAEKPVSLLVTFEPELRYLLGNKRYEELLADSGEGG
jgi:hypothetical protein